MRMADVVQFLRHQTRVSLAEHFPHVDFGSFRGRVLGTFFPDYIDRTWTRPARSAGRWSPWLNVLTPITRRSSSGSVTGLAGRMWTF